MRCRPEREMASPVSLGPFLGLLLIVRLVFSEFSMFDLFLSSWGGTNLKRKLVTVAILNLFHVEDSPMLLLYEFEGCQLGKDTEHDLAQERREHFSRHKASSRTLLAQD